MEYDTGELSPDAIRALKEAVDQYAAVEVLLTTAIAETAKISPLVDKAAREIQYAHGEHRASLYGPCDEAIGEAVHKIASASRDVKHAHESAIDILTTFEIERRRPRTKALHRVAESLKALWPGAKFGR